ncbi:hypothetical protein EMG21_29675, partial [Klebsiella pneumoniae]
MRQQRPPRSTFFRLLRRVVTTVVLLLSILTLFAFATVGMMTGYFAAILKDEPVRSQEELRQQMNNWTQTSYAYFNDKSSIGAMRTDADRKWVKKEEVSPWLIDA